MNDTDQKYCECGEPINQDDDMCLECWKESSERFEALNSFEKTSLRHDLLWYGSPV